MKMKRTLFKLFLMACFLAACWSKDAKAANGQPELDVRNGDIYIGMITETIDGNPVTREVVGYGTAADNVTGGITANHDKGYTIKGLTTNTQGTTITIDVSNTPDKPLNLTFDGLDMTNGGYIHIIKGAVKVSLIGDSIISNINNTSKKSAIQLDNNARLIISSTNNRGSLAISGSPNAIYGTNNNDLDINSGTVTLSGTTPFNAGTILVTGGTLNCYDLNRNKTKFGSQALIQTGGTVIADGLITINYKDHQLEGFEGSNYEAHFSDGTVDKNLSISSGNLSIKEDWYGQMITFVGSQRLGIKIDDRKAGPTVKGNAESHANANDGSIEGFNDTMEYQGPFDTDSTSNIQDDAASWLTTGFDDLRNLKHGFYFVRTRSTNSAFASKPTLVEIKKGKQLDITMPEFTATYGYAPISSQPLKIHNYETAQISIDEIRLSNDKFELNVTPGSPLTGNPNAIIPPDGNSTTITIKPKDGLDAGSHTATVTISYIDPDDSTGKTKVPIPIDVTFTVEKANQDPPTDTELKVEKFTHNSATLIPLSGTDEGKTIEYGYTDDDGKEGKWQTGTKITGLSPSTSYVFHARYAGDANHNPSDSVSSSKITTDPAAYIDYKEGELVLPANRKYTVTINDKKTEYTSDGYGRIKLDTSQFDKKTQIKILDQSNDGEQTLTVNPPAKTPTTPKATDETISGAKDGSISGVSTAMEYRIKTGKNTWTTWDSFSGRTLEDQAPGTYEVRVAATDSAFASKAVTLIIGKGRMLDVTITEFDEMKYGTDPVSRAITIENLDKDNPVNIQGVTVASNAFTITDGDKTIEAQKTSDTWKVQPKAKLNVDTYTAELTVTYNDIVEEEPDDNPDDETQEPGGDTPTTPDDETKEPGGDTPTTPDDETKEPGGDTPTTPDDETQNSGDSKSKVSAQADENAEEVKTESRTVTVPVEVTVVKADQDAPPVPAEKSKTATSITLETIANNPVSGAKAQYSKDGGRTWQDSPTFTGLSANKDYTFVARYAETENYNASDISNGEVTITTSEKNDDDSKSDGVKPQTTDKNNSNGTNGNGTNGTNGNGSNTNGTNGSGTGTNNGSGTNGSDGSSSNGVLSSAKTGDLNNIQLWVALMIGSYLSCAIIIKNRLKKSNS